MGRRNSSRVSCQKSADTKSCPLSLACEGQARLTSMPVRFCVAS